MESTKKTINVSFKKNFHEENEDPRLYLFVVVLDLDECSSPDLHDCHLLARCINVFGGFRCECMNGYRDPWADNKHRQGRFCEQCLPQHCNNRGECKYQNGQEVCM